ncbi:hypothetical protein [Terrarubrum flagellatum]|uniref:hypothetical protein n=1 Tax=Terrirubrum flagellatum TaxID=2895980 RepID=UPI003145662F
MMVAEPAPGATLPRRGAFPTFADLIEGTLRAVIFGAFATAAILLAARFEGGVFAGFLLAIAGAALALAARRGGQASIEHEKHAWRVAGWLLCCAIILFSFVFALAFSAPQVGDFGVLWRCGKEFGLPIQHWLESCHSGYIAAPQLYRERSFFYTVPFHLLLGDNYTAFKIYNATLHALTTAFLFHCCKRELGYRAAFISLAFLAAQPEWWPAIPVASMDNLALLVIVFLLWVLLATERSERRLLTGGGLALAIVLLQWSRTIGALALLSALIFFAASAGKSDWSKRLTILALALIGYFLIDRGLNALLGAQSFADPLTQSIFGFDLQIRPPQNYQVLFEWTQHLLPAISEERRASIGLLRLTDELAHGFLSWPAYMAEKAAILFAGDGYLYFTTVNWPDNLDTIFTVPQSNIPHGHRTALFVQALSIVGATIAAFATTLARRTPLTFASIAYLGVFVAATIGFGPLLNRYGLLAAPAISILVGGLSQTGGAQKAPNRLQSWRVTAIGVLAVAATLLLALPLALSYQAWRPRLLMNIKQEAPWTAGGSACNAKQVPIWPYFGRRIRSSLAPDVTCVSYQVPLQDIRGKLSFFITREKLPYFHENLPPVGFEYAFRIGDEPFVWRSLNDAAARWHEIESSSLPVGAALQLVVRRTRPGDEIQFEIRDLLVSPF